MRGSVCAAATLVLGCNAAAGLDDLSFESGAGGGTTSTGGSGAGTAGGAAGGATGGAGGTGGSGVGGGGGMEEPGCADTTRHIVFITQGSVAGHEGNNFLETCADEAAAAGCGDKTWVPWLSQQGIPTFDAADIIPQGAWYLPDGAKVADSLGDLIDGSIDVPIQIMADETPAGDVTVWTGTLANGQGNGTDCFEWSQGAENGIIGRADAINGDWTNDQVVDCSSMQRLYCFESR